MKKYANQILTVVTAALVIGVSLLLHTVWSHQAKEKPVTKVGFIYDGDTATPYTNNFVRAEQELKEEFGDDVEIISYSNVPDNNSEKSIRALADAGCDIIFTNSFGYGETAKKLAGEYPKIQFCQATCANANEKPVYDNYHTFMGNVYQGRYISGVIAGMKLKEMIKKGVITKEEVKIGYVGAYPYAEVISGYTAFFLGIRQEVPEAVMSVKYTDSWSDYTVEKVFAEELIEEGCVMISQHSDTIGPAVACESARAKGKTVYHVGYNQSMIDIAPTTSILSSRINWNPYIVEAVRAVREGQNIENSIPGNVHGNDIGAGFEKDWVQIVEINDLIAAKGSRKRAEQLIQEFRQGSVPVFQGDYVGVDPFDETDTYDLNEGYIENEKSSAPSFHYVLKDVIRVE